MSKKRVKIEGLPEHLRKEIISRLKDKCDHYLLNIFNLNSSQRKHGRNCVTTYHALREGKRFLGPNQSALAWVILKYRGDMSEKPSVRDDKLAEEYDLFIKKNNSPKEGV